MLPPTQIVWTCISRNTVNSWPFLQECFELYLVTLIKIQTTAMFILIFILILGICNYSMFSVSFLLANFLAFSYIAKMITVCYCSQISTIILIGIAIVVHLNWRDLSLFIRSSYLQLWFSLFFLLLFCKL